MTIRRTAFPFLCTTITLSAIFMVLILSAACQENATSKKVASQLTKSESELIKELILSNYKAMEEKRSEDVLAMYHPKTNLLSSKAELDKFFSQMDVNYLIDDFRFIGSDGENFVTIYHEFTEFRRTGGKKTELVDKEDTDVLMVFRKIEGKFKIFTSRSLKPGK